MKLLFFLLNLITMYCNTLILTFLFFFIANFSYSQEDNKNSTVRPTLFITKNACDCTDAIPLKLAKAASVSFINPPKGFGIQEMQSKDKTGQFFEQEHNSTWYLLTVEDEGELVFEIIPLDSTNDYDFVLYPYTDSTFCKNFLTTKNVTLRSNLTIPAVKSNGKTGLSSKSKSNFARKSAGSMYSKSISVKKGEKYMLVVDNATPNGKGHSIEFNCVTTIIINGKITNVAMQPVNTTITLSDRNNREVAKVANAADGSYKITAELKEDIEYSLLFYNENYMPVSNIVNTNMVETVEQTLTLDAKLSKLKLGETYTLVYFSSTVSLLNVEAAAVFGLAKIMKKYPKMKIQIQGHAAKYELTKSPIQANGGYKIDPTIAEERAEEIYRMLIKYGLAKERMQKIGFSSDRPLVANPKTEEETNRNKRVSIKILSL